MSQNSSFHQYHVAGKELQQQPTACDEARTEIPCLLPNLSHNGLNWMPRVFAPISES